MDANRTRYHLLLGRDDWSRCTKGDGTSVFETAPLAPTDFSWDTARNQVTLGTRVNVYHSASAQQAPTITERRGAAQDRFGNIYWIAPSRNEILVNSIGTSLTTHFWQSTDAATMSCTDAGSFGPIAPAAVDVPLTVSGLTVDEQHYLVAGVLEPAGILVFDLYHGGPPRELLWPPAVPFAPFDIAPMPGGGVWILDRDNSRIWALDRAFGVIRQDQASLADSPSQPDLFAPADGSPAPQRRAASFPEGIAPEQGSPIGNIQAVAITALPDSTVLILENSSSQQLSLIHRFRIGQELGAPVSLDSVLELLDPQDRPGFSLLAYDFAFVALEQSFSGQRQNTLYVVSPGGDQCWSFAVDYSTEQLTLAPYAEYYPMRLFGGRGLFTGVASGQASNVQQVYYDSQSLWVPLILQRRPRYAEQATLVTRVLDGKTPDCVWHRLMLDANIPSDAGVQISSRASNDPSALLEQAWLPEPQPYRRGNGTELPWTTQSASLSTWELLFQQAYGQYLQLQITFFGSGKSTPSVRAMRAYYPRFSYLDHYLPAVYRADTVSGSFLDRFLANFEGIFTSIEDRIATVQAVLDARSTPCEALDWLANWFGVALDPSWSEAKRRLFLKNAAQFFEARGTVPGLTMALRLALEDCADQTVFQPATNNYFGIRIVENFRSRQLPLGLLQDSAGTTGLNSLLQTSLWTPSQGPNDLNSRYQHSLGLPAGTPYPLYVAPTDAAFSQWSAFSSIALGMVPSQPPASSDLWSTFLKNRYTSISQLNMAYRSGYASFADVPFPIQAPQWPQPLTDWYQFQGTLLIQSAAHQFTIYLPLAPGDAQSTTAQRSKLALAQRVTDLERPAHATYELKFYWAFFRVGTAQLGTDSILDAGSRASQLLQPILLGDSYIGSGYLAREQPDDPRHRPFLQFSS